VEHGVSVTWEVDCGTTRLWLTKESGCVPAGCWDGMGCKSCSRWMVARGGAGAAKAYLVLKVVVRLHYTAWSRCAIGELRMESLAMLSERVVPVLQQLCLRDGGGGGESRVYVRAVDYRRVCAMLHRLERGGRRGGDLYAGARFVLQDGYKGVKPYGDGHWFTGMTDAVGEVNSWGGMWLAPCG
jgi:hypothetical protein